MEAKKGFLAIGIILFLCLAATAGVGILGWSWLKYSGRLDAVNQDYSITPIDIERSEFESFIKSIGYACDAEKTTSYGDFETFSCGKQIQDESFALMVSYSRKQNKPVFMYLSIPQSENKKQKEIVASEFSAMMRIPYKGSHPDWAAAWIGKCMAFEDADLLTVTKAVSGVTFSYFTYAGAYQLTISSNYASQEWEDG